MRYLVGQTVLSGEIIWEDTSGFGIRGEDIGLTVFFPGFYKCSKSERLRHLEKTLLQNGVRWLRKSGGHWVFDGNAFVEEFPTYNEAWLIGTIRIDFEHENEKREVFGRTTDQCTTQFTVSPEMFLTQTPRKIFLSHRGLDKPKVRAYASVMRSVGLEPWLDEHEIRAGAELERALLEGFQQSCAAVFFLTKSFKDEKYLATEINYAVSQKRAKNEKFSIISLVLRGRSKEQISIPPLLQTFVWKEPKSDIQAVEELISALPIRPANTAWEWKRP